MSRSADNAADILSTFPSSLARDEDKSKLAESISSDIAQLMRDADKAMIFPRIDELPEELLDILANDLKCEWYDSAGALDEKRATIKDCLYMHRYKGTKFAVKTALQGVYSTVKVIEWFEYDGQPYHFKIEIYDSSNDAEKRQRVLSKIDYYKNLRSVLDNVIFKLDSKADVPVYMGITAGAAYKKIESEVIM